MDTSMNIPPATPESVWAAFRETDRLMKESREEMKQSREDFDHRIEKLEKITGGISTNQGKFAEEYFFNSFNTR